MIDFKKIGKQNLSLIGLMGSGKSIIGKEISKIFDLNHFDSDIEIEKFSGKKISVIFSKFGEDYFRDIEEKICLDLLEKKNCIISLGGGSILSSKVRNMLLKKSYTIYLKVDINILSKRLTSSKKRPLLKKVDICKKLEELYEKRKGYYNRADLIIENELNKNDILSKIMNKIN